MKIHRDCSKVKVAVHRCFTKWMFLSVSENSQENIYAGVSFLTNLLARSVMCIAPKCILSSFQCKEKNLNILKDQKFFLDRFVKVARVVNLKSVFTD